MTVGQSIRNKKNVGWGGLVGSRVKGGRGLGVSGGTWWEVDSGILT